MSTTPHKNFAAGEDLSANQFRYVTPDDGALNPPTVVAAQAGEIPIGIQTDEPLIGKAVGLAKVGVPTSLKIGGTVSFGDFLKSDADARGIATTIAGELYGSIALQDGVIDNIINVEPVSPTRTHS